MTLLFLDSYRRELVCVLTGRFSPVWLLLSRPFRWPLRHAHSQPVQDLTLGVPNVEFVTREEDEFGAIPAMMQTETNMADQGADAHTTASAAATFGVLTHAVLPPQHHRLGLTSSQRREMNEREREARERAARRIPGLGMPAAQEEEVEEEEETQEQERQQEVQHNQDGGESATIVEDDDPVKEWQEQPTQQQQQQQENQQGQSGAVPMEASD